MITSIAGIILAIGTAYNYIVTAKIKAHQSVNDETLKSLKAALETERELVVSLRDEVDRLRKESTRLRAINDEQLAIILELKKQLQKNNFLET